MKIALGIYPSNRKYLIRYSVHSKLLKQQKDLQNHVK